MSVRAPALLIAGLTLALVLAAGCGTEPENKTTPPPAGLQPANDTPEHAIQRLVAAWEKKKHDEYAALLTGNFVYVFSPLDAGWPQWPVTDEDIAALHIFRGGRNLAGESLAPPYAIDLQLASTRPIGDLDRDTTTHKVLGTAVSGDFALPINGADTLIFHFDGSHRFFVVRGDSAQGLAPSQPADASHWYVWRWVDETGVLSAAPGSIENTWGQIKAIYR